MHIHMTDLIQCDHLMIVTSRTLGKLHTIINNFISICLESNELATCHYFHISGLNYHNVTDHCT